MYSSFYGIFKFHFITLYFVLFVYCGGPVLRMTGALANDMKHYQTFSAHQGVSS